MLHFCAATAALKGEFVFNIRLLLRPSRRLTTQPTLLKSYGVGSTLLAGHYGLNFTISLPLTPFVQTFFL